MNRAIFIVICLDFSIKRYQIRDAVFFIPAFDGGNHENSDTKTTKTPLETMESTTRVFHCFKG